MSEPRSQPEEAPGEPVAIGPLRLSRPALVVAIASLGFITLSIWWLTYDRRLPGGGDPGTHVNTVLSTAEYLRAFDLGAIFDLGPIGEQFFYPPLVHVVGAVPEAAFGLGPAQDWGTIALNLVFVPILAAGVYLSGRQVYGPLAGMLAALFALATPIVLSLFHIFVTDTPLAAAVALTFAALLASDRFADRRMTIVAGALVAVCLLIKTAAPLYLAGPVLVMLVGGGWRQWRNLGLAALAGLVIAAPYYLGHLGDVTSLGEETTVGSEIGATGATYERDARLSFDNLTWYAWSAINEQYFLPFLLLFTVGFVAGLRELRRRRHLPELLAGVVFTYLALALMLSIRDARYIVPLVVYVAVISTGWIATTSRTGWRRAGLAVFAVAATLNITAAVTLALPTIRLNPPGSGFKLGNDPGTFTILDDAGYFVGAPQPDPFWDDVLGAARAAGMRYGALRTIDQIYYWGDDPVAFDARAREFGIREATLVAPPAQPDFVVTTWPANEDAQIAGQTGLGAPCGTIEEGSWWEDGEPATVSVLVQRRGAAGKLERWCEFG